MWMNHPSREALLALVEQDGLRRDQEHVDRCSRCRREVEALSESLAAVRDVPVPEPSPFFWDHLSRRVSEAVAAEPVPGVLPAGAGPASWRAAAWMAATAAVVALAVGATWDRSAGTATRSASTVGASNWIDDASGANAAPSDWEFLLNLAGAGDDPWSGDLAEGVQPGMADRAMLALSDAEWAALVEFLETEMRLPSS